jgi:tetratricopeptide (TPR) repeat protein
MVRASLILSASLLAASSPANGADQLRDLLEQHPADSLVQPLRRFEIEHGRFPEGGKAALVLGQLHYARGEYRQAAEAFARAAARLEPALKNEARYWAGVSWLAQRDPSQARAALEEVAQSNSPRRPEAMLALAMAWETAQRPERALEVLHRLLGGDPGEAGPAALEHTVVLAEAVHLQSEARDARARLLREYPNSIEATRAAMPEREAPPLPADGHVTVELGTFSSASRAQSLLAATRRAGFAEASVVVRGEGRARSYVVLLGTYPGAEAAKAAGESAARRLGVSYRLGSPP